LECPAIETGEVFKLPIRIGWVKSIGLVLCPMNLVTENVSNDQFFDESRLEQVFKTMLGGNFLCLADEIDNLADVVHGLAVRLSIPALIVERTIVSIDRSFD
jgi:hypothetical protein